MAVYTSLSQNRILNDILNRKGMGARQASDAQLIGGINRGGSPRVIPASSTVIKEAPGIASQLGRELSQAAVDLESAKKIGREYAARKAVAQAAQPTIVGEPTGDGGAMAVAPSAQSLFATGAEYGDTKAGQFAFRLGERLMNQENLETTRGIAAQNRMTDRTDRLEKERLDRELREKQFDATKVVPINSQADLNRIGRSDVKYDPNRSYFTQGGVLQSKKLTDLMSPGRVAQQIEVSRVKGTGDPNKGLNEELNKLSVKTLGTLQERAFGADNAMANLNMAVSLNEQGEDQVLPSALQTFGGTLLSSIGLDVEKFKPLLGNVADGQKYLGLLNDQLLAKMQAQKGPQTKEDQATMRETLANLGNTKEARTFLLKSARAINQRDIDKYRFYDDYLQKNGNLRGVDKAYFEDQKGMSLFGRNPKTNNFVFYNDFFDAAKLANPNVSREALMGLWKSKYGRN
jgi:hypothetical protein